MSKLAILVNENLVHQLISEQFPEWKSLSIRSVAVNGWDNRTFHLGNNMLVRLPSAECYAGQVEKESYWLPRLAPFLPVKIPEPLALGKSTNDYPWPWGIYRWLAGEAVAATPDIDLSRLAENLANFLLSLHHIDATGGPPPGLHSFHRGGSLDIYNEETRKAILQLKDIIDSQAVIELWQSALATCWKKPPVWVHGDISAGNLLVEHGKLSAVIDFGQLAVGDPACDLAITWTLFKDQSRAIFKSKLGLDDHTWLRAKAWTLWKALITAAGFTNPNNSEAKQCWKIINDVLED
jgi:aminoglycoside phosphotransferase (APT) family kinase protein